MSEKIEVDFQIWKYKDMIVYDIMPMDVYHLLLDRTWKLYRKVVYDVDNNTCKFENDGIKNKMVALKE